MKTVHDQNVSADTYHQFCRYGISVKENDQGKEQHYEKVLLQIAEWIKEETDL